MSDDGTNLTGSRMRHRPLRVPVDEVARHSAADDAELVPTSPADANGAAQDAPSGEPERAAAAPSAPADAGEARPAAESVDAGSSHEELPPPAAPNGGQPAEDSGATPLTAPKKKPSRSSVVAMKSVIVTGATSPRRSSPPPPPTPPTSASSTESPGTAQASPAAEAPAAGAEAQTAAHSEDDVELIMEQADSSTAAEIAAAETAEREALNDAALAAASEGLAVDHPFDDDVSAEITIEETLSTDSEQRMLDEARAEEDAGSAQAEGDDLDDGLIDDDVLEMDDLEEVAPPQPPPASAASAVSAAPEPPAAPPSAPPAAPSGAPTPPRKTKRKPWFEDFFSDDYLRTVRAPTPKEVARECDAILAILNIEPGALILDVGCGLGMHAVELTLRGYIVIGLDLSLPMLSRAADEAQDRGLKINFLHADMREMAFEGGFDAVLCWGTSFGYFDDDGNRAVIERFYSALKPGGSLLIDVVNRDHVIQSQPNLVWFEGDGCICMEETDFNYYTSRLNVKRNVILDNGRQHDRHYSIRLYALHELGQMLHHHGFRVAEVTGRYATPGVFFGAQSPRMVVRAERRHTSRDAAPSLPSVPPPPPSAPSGNDKQAASAEPEATNGGQAASDTAPSSGAESLAERDRSEQADAKPKSADDSGSSDS